MRVVNNSNVNSIRVIRVFLASPGDLGPERKAAREAVDEINRTVARPAGYQVDLVGWEDTLSSVGRPQALINEELESCQMFIGMIWERWGTPPDLTGRFSSGFEEEYTISFERMKKSGSPHMRLFFKDVDPAKVSDAGPELSKVIAFKANRIAEKAILFQSFNDTQAFAKQVRLGIADYITKLRQDGEIRTVSSKSDESEDAEEDTALLEGLGSPASEVELLESLTLKLKNSSVGVTPVEVARLRNLAVVLSASNNDELSLGAHDANLIYANKEELELSGREISALADAGLDAIDNENAPIFSWVSNRQNAIPLWLPYTTFVGPDKRRVNAFRLMRLIRLDVGENIGSFTRHQLFENWFAEGSDRVKIAALQYLGEMARSDEVIYAEQELGKGNYTTKKAAAESVLSILMRHNVNRAAEFLISCSVLDLDTRIIDAASELLIHLKNDKIVDALDCLIYQVRLKAMEILDSRKLMTELLFHKLLVDSNLQVRRIAINKAVLSGKNITDKEAEEILVREKPKHALAVGGRDEKEGLSELTAFRKRRSFERPIEELIKDQETSPFNSDDAFFALCSRQESKYLPDLRRAFDDRFSKFHEKYREIASSAYPDAGTSAIIINFLSENEKFRRRQWMREAANIFNSRHGAEDLSRLRLALDEDAVDPRILDIEYLGRAGTIEDISRIDKLALDYRIGGYDQGPFSFVIPKTIAADAMLKRVGGNVDTLIAHQLSDAIMPSVISRSTKASFKKISMSKIELLINHSSDAVRKSTVLKILQTYAIGEIKSLLNTYVKSEKHRYYNVIVWLDLAIAFPASTLRAIADRELVSAN